MTTKKKKGYGLEIKTFHGKRRSMKRCVRADKLREALARTKMVLKEKSRLIFLPNYGSLESLSGQSSMPMGL
jgi:hypothetical protein